MEVLAQGRHLLWLTGFEGVGYGSRYNELQGELGPAVAPDGQSKKFVQNNGYFNKTNNR